MQGDDEREGVREGRLCRLEQVAEEERDNGMRLQRALASRVRGVKGGGSAAIGNSIRVLCIAEYGGALHQGGGPDRKTQEGHPDGVGEANMDGLRVVGDSGA